MYYSGLRRPLFLNTAAGHLVLPCAQMGRHKPCANLVRAPRPDVSCTRVGGPRACLVFGDLVPTLCVLVRDLVRDLPPTQGVPTLCATQLPAQAKRTLCATQRPAQGLAQGA